MAPPVVEILTHIIDMRLLFLANTGEIRYFPSVIVCWSGPETGKSAHYIDIACPLPVAGVFPPVGSVFVIRDNCATPAVQSFSVHDDLPLHLQRLGFRPVCVLFKCYPVSSGGAAAYRPPGQGELMCALHIFHHACFVLG